MYLNSDLARKELVKVSRGKASRVPIQVLAEYVLNYCSRNAAPAVSRKPADDSVRWLKALYALEDRRGPHD
jgi:hypothetical protein